MEQTMFLFGKKGRQPKQTDQDLWLRPQGDSFVRVGRTDFPVRLWSRRGFVAAPFNGALVPGQLARVKLTVRDWHDPDGGLSVEDQIVVESVDENGLRATWWRLPDSKKKEIAAYHLLKCAKNAQRG